MPEYDFSALARLVSAARRGSGLSVDGLAERSGVPGRMILEIEQGVGDPTVEVLVAIAGCLFIPVRELFEAGVRQPPGQA
jgi:transcriptional regulator with XRE-family HTH domain